MPRLSHDHTNYPPLSIHCGMQPSSYKTLAQINSRTWINSPVVGKLLCSLNSWLCRFIALSLFSAASYRKSLAQVSNHLSFSSSITPFDARVSIHSSSSFPSRQSYYITSANHDFLTFYISGTSHHTPNSI